MEFEWYIIVNAERGTDYEHCPVYLMGEMILSTETLSFVEGQKINQFFDFYRADEMGTQEAETAELELVASSSDEG